LSISECPTRLLPYTEIKAAFLANAVSGDIAVVNVDDGYMEFLAAAQERGIPGPVLFISPEPTMAEGDLHRHNALVLDLKKMGLAAVKNIVHVVLNVAMRQVIGNVPDISLGRMPFEKTEDKPFEDDAAIRERLVYVCSKGFSLTIALEVREHGEPIIARGTCTLKEVQEDSLVFHNFKQSVFLKGMKKGTSLRAYFPYKQTNNEINITVQQATNREVLTTIPTHLFSAKEMRIQPNRNRPISLYVLIPNEPTTNFNVLDISPRGIGFMCPRDLPVDSAYSFTIILPDPQAIVVTSGVIRFKKESSQGVRYGAEIWPHPWDEEHIAKYIMNRETEIMGLLRNM